MRGTDKFHMEPRKLNVEMFFRRLKTHRNTDYFIENATNEFLFTSCKTLENEGVSAAHSFASQSFATSESVQTEHFLYCNLFIIYIENFKISF